MSGYDIDELAYVILLRYSLTSALLMSPHMPGTTVIKTNCGHLGFAAAETREFLENDPRGAAAYILCGECSGTTTMADLVGRRGAMMPGTMKTLEGVIGVSEADQFGAFLRDIDIEELP